MYSWRRSDGSNCGTPPSHVRYGMRTHTWFRAAAMEAAMWPKPSHTFDSSPLSPMLSSWFVTPLLSVSISVVGSFDRVLELRCSPMKLTKFRNDIRSALYRARSSMATPSACVARRCPSPSASLSIFCNDCVLFSYVAVDDSNSAVFAASCRDNSVVLCLYFPRLVLRTPISFFVRSVCSSSLRSCATPITSRSRLRLRTSSRTITSSLSLVSSRTRVCSARSLCRLISRFFSSISASSSRIVLNKRFSCSVSDLTCCESSSAVPPTTTVVATELRLERLLGLMCTTGLLLWPPPWCPTVL
eukprot:PhM_4_TR2363/c0_g1_i1/m.105288